MSMSSTFALIDDVPSTAFPSTISTVTITKTTMKMETKSSSLTYRNPNILWLKSAPPPTITAYLPMVVFTVAVVVVSVIIFN